MTNNHGNGQNAILIDSVLKSSLVWRTERMPRMSARHDRHTIWSTGGRSTLDRPRQHFKVFPTKSVITQIVFQPYDIVCLENIPQKPTKYNKNQCYGHFRSEFQIL